jgi:hypothetical protein
VSIFTRLRRFTPVRLAGRTVTIAVALLAAAIVSSLTIDLGPAVRSWAERVASNQLKRPIHIGRLSIHVLSGRVIVEDFSIDGLRPADRPFFSAKRLAVALDWSTLVRKDITIETVDMTDWQMLVERWDDRHNFPKFTSGNEDEPDRPARFTTTLKSLRATRGQFTFDDHEKPWSTVARNLDVTITNFPTYHGEATFHDGTVTIQDYLPMWANMRARFTLDKSRIHLDRIDLQTDGATSVATGDVDLKRWPEQAYQVTSRVNFPRMREIFFGHETWRLSGDGDFTGTFRLFKGGHDLRGAFSSEVAGVNEYRFPALYGSLEWTPAAFKVWDAGSKFFDGAASFAYAIAPLGSPRRPDHRFDFTYSDVDMAAFSDFQQWPGLRFEGRASGSNRLEWPAGRFAECRGEGRIAVSPPSDVTLMTSSLGPARGVDAPAPAVPLAPHLPMSGELIYRFDPDMVELGSGLFATTQTHVTFEGSTAWGDRSRFAFHVTSRDWQESDQLLAGLLTDFGSRTSAFAVGGRGQFDGVMTGAIRKPRVEGIFSVEDLRAWDTLWGTGAGKAVIENSYVRVTEGIVRRGTSEIRGDGLFSLGYPRDDGGEEIDARFRVARRDLDSLRHAFKLDDYPVTGQLSGEFHLTGPYEHPLGFGGMTIDNGTAYSEPFQKATASLRFDGTGVRLDGVTIDKNGGTVTGAAFVGWDSTYSFNAVGRQIPVERITALSFPKAPLSGIAEFSAGGSGMFDTPRYDIRFRASSLFFGEEGIGEVTGSLERRGKELSGEIAAASPRLAMTGTGRIALTPQVDAEMTFRFHESSLDPYVRLFVPRLSPFTTAVSSGTVRVVGELANLDHLLVDGMVDTLDMRLFDYTLRNAIPVHIALDRHVVKLDDLQLAGEGTQLHVSGTIGLRDQRIALQASGDASLGLLQGFFKDVRSSGRAALTAAIDGPLREPLFSGRATITDGRLRHFSLPNSLDAINGVIHFDASGIRLDEVTAKMGEGLVQFGGHIGFKGYVPSDLDVTAHGEDMHLRYPEGVQSTLDADLSLQGSLKAPTLGGTVTVKRAVWSQPFDAPGSILDLAGRRSSNDGGAGLAVPSSASQLSGASPLRYEINILIPSTLHISNGLIQQMTASADLKLLGTSDKPLLSGRADVERGELNFRGRRYKLTRGTIDFNNPARIDPFFDVEAETNVRVPGQTYHVTVSAAGTADKLNPVFQSDPYLPPGDVLALLFSESRRTQGPADVELLALQNPNQRQTDILATQATEALASPISQSVGKVVEQTFGVDTFQLTPFIDPYSQQSGRVNPAARITIGKRISDRVYLTYSRSLNTPVYDQIILLEYDESDRLSWILSRNEDTSYALEFRVRHVF